jgi:hypothetical protein
MDRFLFILRYLVDLGFLVVYCHTILFYFVAGRPFRLDVLGRLDCHTILFYFVAGRPFRLDVLGRLADVRPSTSFKYCIRMDLGGWVLVFVRARAFPSLV